MSSAFRLAAPPLLFAALAGSTVLAYPRPDEGHVVEAATRAALDHATTDARRISSALGAAVPGAPSCGGPDPSACLGTARPFAGRARVDGPPDVTRRGLDDWDVRVPVMRLASSDRLDIASPRAVTVTVRNLGGPEDAWEASVASDTSRVAAP